MVEGGDERVQFTMEKREVALFPGSFLTASSRVAFLRLFLWVWMACWMAVGGEKKSFQVMKSIN